MSRESIRSIPTSIPSTVSAPPRTPNRPDSQTLFHWSKDEIVNRVLELEHELQEFQDSSKDLEKALEDELQNLEEENARVSKDDAIKTETIKELNLKIKSLKTEINELNDKHNDEKRAFETEIMAMKQQLVEVEITNDNMESKDRLISNKLESLNSFNMELLEKIALLENDLYLEKKINTEKNLHIINYENTISDLKGKILFLEKKQSSSTSSKRLSTIPNTHRTMHSSTNKDDDHDITEVDVSYLSMKDVLNAGPPVSPYVNNIGMKKSDSLKKLHDLSMRSEGLSHKFKNLRRDSLYLKSPPTKSPSTTQLSNHLHITKSTHDILKMNQTSNDPVQFEKSKTSKNLTQMLYKESGALETIAASPISSKPSANQGNGQVKEPSRKKKSKRSNILGGWFH
ncbi:NADH:ubiquinone oxidoreductase [Yamadazyma tenuis]|uniref:NUDE domain-containing protein n=1 Tax=Candida tenuis (strain ATCC 10573 / BCRC 21748 / CBS 615 / JCM 9827 / NBRC 10315 / NRRL Y-1498 / VKM Y-70) TaxID=590646 RepID=G3B936_CANTC|nr:uncharacterized protein CANTEDRAFT_131795 [Yamadazyma tenuis ATCC 10573]EGV62454.1 hypothetical protein CANTEDRAFT_131795 [Yamadazyma tenuis ATCC 10573]WEJ93738.1 NADH:ubiquinone oxidoreductase [Yamadazyma tenuis]